LSQTKKSVLILVLVLRIWSCLHHWEVREERTALAADLTDSRLIVLSVRRRAQRRLEAEQTDVDGLSGRSAQGPRSVQRAAVGLLGDDAGQVLVNAGLDWHRH